ncbi:BspA family leucine-rich repeat surface protein [Chryseobacterium chendengshani]|uniref:BspA family leucine-rich repeat surface protein n=1 Tax=Chryseobacterium sp. LJ668 TaxID=2864040 RepID=UPI001C68ED35|nr:BspA family leucine-rich repeat surface protein [Chryseobacterium sp. LJ668]MBW8523912.1 BspA family leucine-rich repeat surface protein [Chryseobacterium sp. LJ668]QYK16852.1 BspA family leucine-rich repeat surface protein [Chryseobacterium sp. LJ668]
MRKIIMLFIFVAFFQITNAQDEFITIWKPGITQQIHFPGRGTNFNVTWEEIGYPQHNGNVSDINSTVDFTINFGTPLNPSPANATYRVKISNGNGNFNQVKFFDNTITPIYLGPDREKLLNVSQWGNIQWQTFDNAFVFCTNLDITAPDAPDLSLVTSTREMFYLCSSLVGNASFNNWDTSNLTTINSMFSAADQFNAPIGNWDVSNVTDFYAVFDMASNFNQPLRDWDTSNATTMEHMFHGASSFNQNIEKWNTSGVANMDMMFAVTTSFNQNIGSWNLSSLESAVDMLISSGLNCQNYDNALFGWNNNPQTPNSINLGNAAPLHYTHPAAVASRNNLITNKNWLVTGDNYNVFCNSILQVAEADKKMKLTIYPNPADHIIFLKNNKNAESFIITDATGRIIKKDTLNKDYINIQNLSQGNYILQIITKDGTENFKFIKK